MEFFDDYHIRMMAEKITEKYYKKDRGAMRRWKKEGWEQTIYDTEWTLKKLRLYISLDNPKGFYEYLDWLVTVLTSRNVDFRVIFDHAKICLNVIKSESKKQKGKPSQRYVELMEKGLEYLRNNAPPTPDDEFDDLKIR